MNTNGERPDGPDLRFFEQNRSKFPMDELAKYAGKHIAFSSDGTRIVASGVTEEELDAVLTAAGIRFINQVVYSYVDEPGVSRI
jgi:hypothetical protein